MLTGKAPAYIGLLMTLLLLALLSRNSSLAALALPLLGVVFISSLLQPRETTQLSIHREIEPTSLTSINSVRVELTITNLSKNPVRSLELADQLSRGLRVISGSNRSLLDIRPHSNVVIEYQIIPSSRGQYQIGPVKALFADPAKIFTSESTIGEPSSLSVYPERRPAKIRISPRKTRSWWGAAPSRKVGVGMEFHGIRDYQRGDEFRSINWKATARLNRIVTNEYETERAVDTVMILDAGKLSGSHIGSKTVLDYEAEAGLSIASFLLSGGNRVGLILHGHFRHWLYPGFGRGQYHKLREQLMLAQEGDSEISLAFLVTQLAPMILSPGSQIILMGHSFSPGLPEAIINLRSLGYHVTCILIQPYGGKDEMLTPASLAGRIASMEMEKSTVLVEQLCPTAHWRVDESLDHVLRRLNLWVTRPQLFAP